MADFYPAFAAELKAVVLTQAGVDADHYFTSLQALQQNIVQELSLSEGGDAEALTAPYVVVEIGRLTHDHDYGLTMRAKRAPVRIWYIDQIRSRTGQDNQEYVHSKAYDIGHFIDEADPNVTSGVTTFQVIDETCEIDSSAMNDANAAFLEANVKLIAACVSWSIGLLVGADS